MIQEPLPQELEQELRTELTAGERLLWSGRPRTGVIFRLADGFNLLFGIIWLGFVSYWLFFAYQSGASILFMAFGLPFLLVGLYMTVGRLITDALQRKKMVYAVTNQRVIILQGIWNRSVRSLNLHSLPETHLISRSDGSGSIFFGQAATYGSYIRTSGRMGALGLSAFETIPNVRSVHEIILRAQREVVDYLPDEA